MAYLCIIASDPRHRIEQIRVPADVFRIACFSHFVVPAGPELRDAVNGGKLLDIDTWRPLREFMLHEPAVVPERSAHLASFATQTRETGHPLHGDTWTQAEAAKVVDLFQYASTAGEAVVTLPDLTRTEGRFARFPQ